MKTTLRLTIVAFGLAIFNLSAASVIQFSALTYNVTEGVNAQVEVAVQRTNDLDTVVSVDFATTTNGTATAGTDYVEVSTNLTFLANETNKTVAVPILNDGLVEPIETIQVALSNPTGGAVLGVRTNATVRITDNDTGLQFEFSAYSVAEGAGSVLIGIVRGDDGNVPVTVDYASTDVTATNGVDYVGVTNTLSFAAGEKVRLFTIPILNDSLKKPNRTLRLSLSNPTGGAVLGAQKTATVTIVDNDPGVQFEYNKYWVRENDGALAIRVLRGNDVELGAFTVDYATTNLTATAGEDYTETKGTLEFAAGETVKLLTIPITYDEVAEADETFTVTLSNVTGVGALGTISRASVTILDVTGTVAHRFDSIAVLPDQSVQLRLGGGVHKRFRPYFDLYPIEVSTDLLEWTPLTTLVRTNASTNALLYAEASAAGAARRFYRTAATNLCALFPPPTGPYAVGTLDRVLTDPSRRNRYGIPANSSFMATFWFPVQPKAGILPGPMFDSTLARYLVSAGYAPHFAYIQNQAFPDRILATNRTTYPVLIYSCGGGAFRRDNSIFALELASHGYIVVSADHEDIGYAQLPDGGVVAGTLPADSVPTYQSRFKDIQIVLDELEKMNAADEMFRGHIDLERIGICGWSTGGVCGAEVCLEENRVRVGVLLDPGFISYVPHLLTVGISRPFLVITGELADGRQLFDKATGTAYWLHIAGTSHMNMGIPPLLDGGAQNRRLAQVLQGYGLSMLNKYLQDSDDHLLDGPSPSYPEVKTILRK